MEIIRLTYPLHNAPQAIPVSDQALAIGYFDGVHLGHQHVIAQMAKEAERLSAASAILTFDPHPREVLGYVKQVKYLTPLQEKLRRFEALGADRTYVLRFDRGLSLLEPEAFIEQILLPLRTAAVAVGFNFTFGHKGRGTAELLRESGGDRFKTVIVRPVHMEGAKVSSTLIREMLLAGDVSNAARLLGRPYRLRGTVVHGEAKGRTIGFPTANLSLEEPYLIPGYGVYAVKAGVFGEIHNGVMNIGIKPTFQLQEEAVPTLEVHLMDYEGDLYGADMTVDILGYIRPEQRFAGIAELSGQIRTDIERAQAFF